MRIFFKILLLSGGFCFYFLGAQEPLKYSISFPNAAHHEAQVTVEFADIKSHPLKLLMSRSSPGRYSLHEFAKNVYNVKAFDRAGKELDISRPTVYQWDVNGNSDFVRVSYTIFGNRCDGTYLAIDNSHAHMNIPATFMWARDFEEHPVEIRFNPADKKWKVATQLKATDDPYLFTAPNMDYFMDSPVELSDFKLREWSLKSGDKTYTIRLAVHHQESDAVLSACEKITKAMVNEHVRIFGELPDFDYDSYTFICCFLPWAERDGMEHRNSTILTGTRPLSEDYFDIFDGISHEFFHSWNVERLRPRSLQPFDFSRTNMSGELWFAEGFSNYYSTLVMARSGLYHSDSYARKLTDLLNYVLNNPGLSVNNAVAMSRYAPFVDAGRSNDPKNLANTFISYYNLGEAIALGLDLSIRKKFPKLSLDDYMKTVWQKFGKNETLYHNEVLQQQLADISGDTAFAADFFDSYIYGHALPDFGKLLALGGFILEKSKADSAWLGSVSMDFIEGKMIIGSPARKGSPLYQAGLDIGDTIRTIGGDSLTNHMDWKAWLAGYKPGQTVEIIFNSRGIRKKASLTMQGNPTLKVVPFEQHSKVITAAVQAFRRDWLGFTVEEKPAGLERYCPQCNRAFPFRFDYCSYDGSALQLTHE